MTETQKLRALSVITDYDRRCKLPTSGLALMFEALADAEADVSRGRSLEAAIRDNFNDPLASRILRAIA